MKKYTAYIFAAILALAFSTPSCRPEPIDIGVAPAPVKLVATSQIIPGQVMIVGLTRSFSALSEGANQDTIASSFTDSILVENAIVTVDHPGGTDTLFMIAPGIYVSVTVLLSNYGSYTLRAFDPATNLSITAVTQLMPTIIPDSVTPYFEYQPGDTNLFVYYEMTDFPAEENFYVVNYYRKNSDTSSSFDPNTYFQQGQNQLNGFDLITEADFDQNGRLSRNRELEGIGYNDTIAVTISHITKGYYEFLTAYKRSGSLINQLTGEPINFPTNVQGGYGYFNAHFPSVRIFELVDYH
ncbi:MAG: DUF4249 family protein [Bacteroidia bacterium]